MKRKFLATRNAVVRDRHLVIGASVLAIALFVLMFRIVAPELLVRTTAPVFTGSAAMSDAVGDFFGSFHERTKLVGERDALAGEVEALRARERALTEQLSDLSRLIGERGDILTDIPAAVLMRPPVSPYDSYVIDAGTADGVAVGAYASGPGGVPLGTIESAEKHTARLVLFSASGRVTEGWAGSERTPITLHGEGAGAFVAQVPQGTNLAQGDAVIVPGFGSAPVGVVKTLESDPSSPFTEVSIAPLVNPFSITWVAVRRTTP